MSGRCIWSVMLLMHALELLCFIPIFSWAFSRNVATFVWFGIELELDAYNIVCRLSSPMLRDYHRWWVGLAFCCRVINSFPKLSFDMFKGNISSYRITCNIQQYLNFFYLCDWLKQMATTEIQRVAASLPSKVCRTRCGIPTNSISWPIKPLVISFYFTFIFIHFLKNQKFALKIWFDF